MLAETAMDPQTIPPTVFQKRAGGKKNNEYVAHVEWLFI